MEILNELKKICKIFNEKNINYILIGGLAIFLHNIPRYTEDIDFIFLNIPEEIDKIKDAFFSLYQDNSINELTPEDMAYSVVRYGTPENFNIDLIFKIGELADYNDLIKYKQTVKIDNIDINFLSEEGLIFLKKNSLRPKDREDIIWLNKKLSLKGTFK